MSSRHAMGLLLLVLIVILPARAAETAAPKLIPDSWSRPVVIPVPPARPKPPTIDGLVNYQEWYYASVVDGFIDMDTGLLSPLPVRMYLCYDDQHVYTGIVIHRPPMNPTPRATFPAGRHSHIWWQDDGFELVVSPGRPEQGVNEYYAFAGNSVGAWSNMRGSLGKEVGGDTTFPGQWVYKAQRAGRDNWHAELAIPVAQFTHSEKPAPGAVWFMDLMNQQVTPQKKMVDLGLIWGYGVEGYKSPYKARLQFVGDNGPIIRPHGLGRLPGKEDQPQTMGLRQVFYNQGQQPYTLEGEIHLFRAPARRPAGVLDFFGLWDRLLMVRRTGQPVTEAKMEVQAFRNEADLLRELNERYQFLAQRQGKFTVAPGGAAYFNLEQPVAEGEYLAAYRFSDPQTGEVLAAQVVPYGIMPALEVTLRPYFLQHEKLRAEAKLENLERREGDQIEFTLTVAERRLDRTVLPITPEPEAIHAFLSTRGVAAGDRATVTARLLGADGQSRVTHAASIERPPTPEWFGNRIGRSAVVPPPFAPVQVGSGRGIKLWERLLEPGDNGLPRSIQARGTELLAQPVRLDLGALRPVWKLQRVSADPRQVIFTSTATAGGLRLTLRAATHYDGTTRYDLTLDPGNRPAALEKLVLEIPVANRWARLAMHPATWTDPHRTDHQGFAGSVEEWLSRYPDGALPFTYACYLGAEDRGVQWFAESDRGWSNRDETKVVSLRQEGPATVLRVAMVDQPLELKQVWQTTFGLTVTPVKDSSAGRAIFKASEGHPAKEALNRDPKVRAAFFEAYRAAGITEVKIYMSDDNHFGSPRLWGGENERVIREFVQAVHQQGLKVTPYAGWGVNDNIPDFATFGQEMLAEPIKNIGWGCFLHNPASIFSDWWLAGTRHTIEEVGMDGTYMDALVLPRLLFNELDGFGWTDAQGRLRGTYPLWALRDFMERLYIYTHVESPRPAIVRNHQNHELYCLGAFCDQRVTGEGHYSKGKTILEVASLPEFRAYFMTHLNGVATTALWPGWLNLAVTPNQMESLFLLHDVPRDVGGGVVKLYANRAGYGAKTEPWVRLKKIRDAFEGAEFLPYWQETPLVTTEPGGLLASAWVDRQKGRALVVVSNLSTEPWTGNGRVNHAALGLPDAAQWRDAMFDRPLTANAQGALPLRLEPQSYRLLITGDRVPLPEKAILDETAEP